MLESNAHQLSEINVEQNSSDTGFVNTNPPISPPPVSSPAVSPPAVPPPPHNKSLRPLFISIAFVMILLLVAGVVAYYLQNKNQQLAFKLPFFTTVTNNNVTNTKSSNEVHTPLITTQTTNVAENNLFTGVFKRLDRNLKIFKLNKGDSPDKIPNDAVYYSAGVFNKGELQGYTRIIAIKPSWAPTPPLVYILATKDFKSYYLHDPDHLTTKYKEDSWDNPYSHLDKNKIIGIKTFATEQPSEIKLDDRFSLYFQDFPTTYEQIDHTNAYNQPISRYIIDTDFSKYQRLASSQKYLSFYFKPYQDQTNKSLVNHPSPAKQDIEEFVITPQLKKQYYLGTTQVIVVDSTGLPMRYLLTTQENVAQYKKDKTQYELNWAKYQKLTDQLAHNEGTTERQPSPPEPIPLPSIDFTSDLIKNKTSANFYNQYSTSIPTGCSFSVATRIVKVSQSDLQPVGKVNYQPVYKLADPNHPLYKMAYKNKIGFSNISPNLWDQINKGVQKPTFQEYVAKNPLLFIKDYWGRWICLGEHDFHLPPVAGKPVVYLYPPQPTDVEVRFITPVQFTTDIPTYHHSWRVKAFPNGDLQDLQPSLTDCDKINTHQKGLEYAYQACNNHIYPYLFWAGNVISQNYPVINKGWIIKKAEVPRFLDTKLAEIGLNATEKKDFIDYWGTEITRRDAPYYKISFLQTQTLNSLFPMVVTPRPDTVFRIFVDHQPLINKPAVLPQPQKLNKLVRRGFTLVEWGGRENF